MTVTRNQITFVAATLTLAVYGFALIAHTALQFAA